MPERIRLSRARGWRIPPNTVNVARPGKWGNPFVVGKDGTRLQCAAMYAILTSGFIDLGGRLSVDEQLASWRQFRRSLKMLAGKNLACWCPLDGGACHGDVLLAFANGRPLPAWLRQEITLPRVRLGMRAEDVEKGLRKRRDRDGRGEAGQTAKQAGPEGRQPGPKASPKLHRGSNP